MYEQYQKLLEKTGKTTYQVCKETGIKCSTIYNWKSRGGELKASLLLILARYFQVTVDYFFDDGIPSAGEKEVENV